MQDFYKKIIRNYKHIFVQFLYQKGFLIFFHFYSQQCLIYDLKPTQDFTEVDLDEKQLPIMTTKTLRYYLTKDHVPFIPPPTKISLQNKFFSKIDAQALSNISTEIQALYLDHNVISKIQGLSKQANLLCLQLNHNNIQKIQNLQFCTNLRILNLSRNKIERIQNLSKLINLQTLNLAQNFLICQGSICGILECPLLNNLDLSQNQLECTQAVFNVITKVKTLFCLYMKSTPLSRGYKSYRKKLIGNLKKLRFLDDRPVQAEDHRLSQAFLRGGVEEERQQKQKMFEEKQEKEKKMQLLKTQEQAKNSEEQNKRQDQQLKQKIVQKTMQKSLQVEQSQKKQKQDEARQQMRFQQKNIQSKSKEQKHEKQQIYEQEKAVLEDIENLINKQNEDLRQIEANIEKKWNKKYQPLLEALLQKYRFDFKEVQPSFNMILADINKKSMKVHQRFQVQQLRLIWTQVQIRRRKQRK